jgi:clan AA aspartic protease
MMTGTVTAAREIELELEILTAQTPVALKAVLDTGFNGHLTLPAAILAAIGAPRVGTRKAALADGTSVDLKTYVVTVQWHGGNRQVLALEADATPLVGMSMLWGARVTFVAQTGGSVTIDPIPVPGSTP